MSGVVLPNTVTVSGRKLVLNGIGLRTVSILAVHICKIACNTDPVRGVFRVQFRPL
jgi:hypothetical protein